MSSIALVDLLHTLSETNIMMNATMNQTEWDEMYRKLYDAYEYSMVRNEQIRHDIGELLDYMISINKRVFK